MRRFFILFFIIIMSNNLLAQESGRRGFIGISLGPSMPVGDYADKSLGNSGAGFAKNGIGFTPINFGYKFGKNFGISALWSGAAHSVDIDGIDATWSYGGVMAGPMYSISLNEKLDIDLRGMVGFVSATADLKEYENNEGTGVSIDLGTSLRYNFATKWCFLISADFFTSKPKMNEGKQKMSSFNIGMGIAYRLK